MYGIFTYMYHENQPNVGRYTSPMAMGSDLFWGTFSTRKYPDAQCRVYLPTFG